MCVFVVIEIFTSVAMGQTRLVCVVEPTLYQLHGYLQLTWIQFRGGGGGGRNLWYRVQVCVVAVSINYCILRGWIKGTSRAV